MICKAPTETQPRIGGSYLALQRQNEPTRMRPVSTFEGASTQTDVPALREDNEPVNNGPSNAEFLTQNKHIPMVKR